MSCNLFLVSSEGLKLKFLFSSKDGSKVIDFSMTVIFSGVNCFGIEKKHIFFVSMRLSRKILLAEFSGR